MKIKDNYTGGNILWFNDFYFENGNILFSVGNFNGLYKYAVKERKLIFLGMFREENKLSCQLYGKIHKYKDKLFFTPLGADNIAVYNLKSCDFDYIPLPVPKNACGAEGKFFNSIRYNNSIFFFPGYFSYILKYDLENQQIEVHDKWYEEYMARWGKHSDLLFGYDIVQSNSYLYFSSMQYNGFFKYCLSDCKYEFIDIKYPGKCLVTLTYDGNYFWGSTDKGILIKMDMDGLVKDMADMNLVYGVEGPFSCSDYMDGYLYLFVSKKSMILKINCINFKSDYEVITYTQYEKETTNLEYHTVNFTKKMYGSIYFQPRSNREIMVISKRGIENYLPSMVDTSGYSEREVTVEDIYEVQNEKMKKYNFYHHYENNIVLVEKISLLGTLDYILKKCGQYGEKNVKNNAGSIIYEKCFGRDNNDTGRLGNWK